jgi:AcrR family transcriptional regulator
LTPVTDPAPLSPKAEQTRQSIVDAAMRLFRTGGYEKTTMRAIAGEAGVSLGNAYYYFGSKEHLIQAYYDRMQESHTEAVAGVLASEPSFAPRLRQVLLAWVDVAAPYHEFAAKFFKNAAEPTSPLSPFSPESKATREAAIDVFRQTVNGSDVKVTKALREDLPELLWLLQMGVVLFWVYDDSAGQARTRALVERAVPLVDRLVRMTRLPVVRGVVDDVVELVHELRR